MRGPGDDDEVFQSRDGDDVPWEDLSDAGMTSLGKAPHWHKLAQGRCQACRVLG
jgi:hypothetical protein